jgi:hypothetical protein
MMAQKREKRFQSMDALVTAIDGRAIFHKLQTIALVTLAGLSLVFLGMMIEYFRH